MSAARVLNPVVFSEFCKIGSPNVSRNLPCGRQLNRIKRDLFGAANPKETKQIFVEELEKHQEKASKKWGFDFRAGMPINANANAAYVWERVSNKESHFAPEMYTLTRAAHVRPTTKLPTAMDLLLDERSNRENSYASTSAESDSCEDSQDEMSPVVFKVPTTVKLNNSAMLRKRQPKITEYMKERKRLAQTLKKVSPAKRMRTSSGSSSSSAGNESYTLSAYLLHQQQRRH